MELGKKMQILQGMTIQEIIIRFGHRIALTLLGAKAPSVFAEDHIELLTDFQYLADAAAMKGIMLRANGEHSLFRRIPGFSVTL